MRLQTQEASIMSPKVRHPRRLIGRPLSFHTHLERPTWLLDASPLPRAQSLRTLEAARLE
ncbi:MAG: hypothetical protein A2Y95_02080 [Deltaproteobacteria bacterium RBG_13_65_10]|nr:MAG: hypothetical protein A2Y95_02080 [Deltaproteobacteria bacterium RBG_13_65_10]